jgi:hypothetical protein
VRTGSTAYLRDATIFLDAAVLIVRRDIETSNEPDALDKAVKSAAKALGKVFSEREADEALARYLTRSLSADWSFRDFDVVYDDRSKTIRPVIVCGDFAEALKVHLWLNMFRASTIATCLRCSARYIRKKKTDLYCSPRCGSYVRQQRFQAAKRQKVKGRVKR